MDELTYDEMKEEYEFYKQNYWQLEIDYTNLCYKFTVSEMNLNLQSILNVMLLAIGMMIGFSIAGITFTWR